MSGQSCMHCYISGTVQGVWFRASAKEQAELLGIQGWARNLQDGRVEVIACGDTQDLELFYEWLQQGPRMAKVEQCTHELLPWQKYDGFKII